MKVHDILRVKGSTLFTVTPETALQSAVLVMSDHDIGSLIVMESWGYIESINIYSQESI